MKTVIAIIGGIGSGKSVVSEILRTMDYPVYDCDSNAKLLMNRSDTIKNELIAAFGDDVVSDDGTINRVRLSDKVFGNETNLSRLNAIVHPAVIEDFNKWVERQCSTYVFVETAILYESGMDKCVDEIWEVTAPVDIRIERVMRRNGISEEAVRSRIESQSICGVALREKSYHEIINDGIAMLLPQVVELIRQKQ